jgi:hypothetical protein
VVCDGLLDCARNVRGDHVSIVVDAWFCCSCMHSVCSCVCTSYIHGRVFIEVKDLAFLGMLATPTATTRNYLNNTQHSACAKHRLYHTQTPKAFRANTFCLRRSLSVSAGQACTVETDKQGNRTRAHTTCQIHQWARSSKPGS